MARFGRRHVLLALAILTSFLVVSLILSFLFPTPPSSLTMATAFKGGSFDYYGHRYREQLSQAGIDLQLKETEGALDNLKLLNESGSGIVTAFVTGGVSNAAQSPNLLSLGVIDYLPIWIFHSASFSIERLSDFKGKRIAIGPVGSGTRHTAERVLSDAGITSDSAQLMAFAGLAAAEALQQDKVDAAWVMGSPNSAAVQALVKSKNVRLFNFDLADAYARRHSNLVKLVLPRGVLDVSAVVPNTDVILLATTSSVLVRNDLHPTIATLLLQTMKEVHGSHGIFQKIGEFPLSTDPDYPVAQSAIEYYKSGPSFLHRHLPLWLIVHVQRAVTVAIAALAVGYPIFHYLPTFYTWYMRRRLLFWYSQLKKLEETINLSGNVQSADFQMEIDRIEDAVSRIRFPLALTNQLYDLRGHIELVRRRFSVTHPNQA